MSYFDKGRSAPGSMSNATTPLVLDKQVLVDFISTCRCEPEAARYGADNGGRAMLDEDEVDRAHRVRTTPQAAMYRPGSLLWLITLMDDAFWPRSGLPKRETPSIDTLGGPPPSSDGEKY